MADPGVEGDAHPDVAVVGAGPVGLTLAGRLVQHGIRVALFDAQPGHVAEGSKALCMQRETLEIWDRLGVGERVARRGVQWQVGRTYFRDRELFAVTLPGSSGDHFPPFVNISQTEVEALLLARLADLGAAPRWGHELRGLAQDATGVTLRFANGATASAAYAVGTDGAHSAVRHAMGVGFDGHTFADRFLIADVRADLPFPNERRFFFDPPWNPGRQVLIHPQPNGVWRIDWQVPPETDVDAERENGGLDRRICAVIGPGVPYELVWLTGYRFSQRLADRFRVGRAFLAGDAAHLMSPFGARGLNSGAADAENLAWKLAAVLHGEASDALLDTYEVERRAVATENLAVTEATMRFMVPHGLLRRLRRDAVLRLSARSGWARRRVNSGRLAEPATYSLGGAGMAGAAGTAGTAGTAGAMGRSDLRTGTPRVGAVLVDLRLSDGRRLRELTGSGFVAVVSHADPPALDGCRVLADPVLAPVYAPDGAPRAWLIRPDGHLAATGPPQDLADMLARARFRASPRPSEG